MITAAPPSPFHDRGAALSTQETAWRSRFDEQLYQPARTCAVTDDPDVYANAYRRFFATLDELDDTLNTQRYLTRRPRPSLVDEWFAGLLVRFATVFYGLYKLNRQRLEEFSNLGHYLRDVVAVSGCVDAAGIGAIQRSYYLENKRINPLQRVPLGRLALDTPHDRELRFGNASAGSDRDEDQTRSRQAGEWVRPRSAHRFVISSDANARFAAEPGRYHLYVANNCPWSHRAALVRSLKGLENIVSMDVLFYRRDPERGWQFAESEPGCTPDTVNGKRYVREIYASVGSQEKSVPLLWDRKTGTIVSNESAEIIRMFDRAFGLFGRNDFELYPDDLAQQIDRVNAFTFHAINNGAYKAGFAAGQEAYETAYKAVFAAFDQIDQMLRGRRFLLGDRLTEADVRLFPTIFRFDAVYYTRFNLDQCMVRDVPSLQRWLETMLAIPAVRRASDLEHCRKGYFGRSGNNIVPLAPGTRGS